MSSVTLLRDQTTFQQAQRWLAPVLTRRIDRRLHAAACAATLHADPKGSHFPVGAAAWVGGSEAQPRIITGWNRESQDGEFSFCAEDGIGSKREKGDIIKRLVVVGGRYLPLAPCGNCREFLKSIVTSDAQILLSNAKGGKWVSLGDLLPEAYEEAIQVSSLPQDAIELIMFHQALKCLDVKLFNPFTKKREAAVVRTEAGILFSGAHLDDAAYKHIPALEAALASANTAGARKITHVLLAFDRPEQSDAAAAYDERPAIIDGRTRQRIYQAAQISGTDFKVIIASKSGRLWRSTISQLLPYPFGPNDLGVDVGSYA